MATTKTITVTNQTVSIPEFTDRPDARVFSDAEGKCVDGINANTDAIAKSIIGSDPNGIATSADLDNYTTPGLYVCPSTATAGGLSHCPVAVPFSMTVRVGTSSTYPVQELVARDTGAKYIRSKGGSGWTSWQELALNSRIDGFLTRTSIANFSANNDTWTATSNGFVNVISTESVTGTWYAYAYEGNTVRAGGMGGLNGTGGLTESFMFPVHKGITYKLLIGGISSVTTQFYPM